MLRLPTRLSLALPRDQVIGTSTCTIVTRSYATPAKASGSRKKAAEKSSGPRGSRSGEGAGDTRLDLIKKVRFILAVLQKKAYMRTRADSSHRTRVLRPRPSARRSSRRPCTNPTLATPIAWPLSPKSSPPPKSTKPSPEPGTSTDDTHEKLTNSPSLANTTR